MLNYLHEMSREDIIRSFEGTYVAANIPNQGRKALFVRSPDGANLVGEIDRKPVRISKTCIDLTQPDLGMMWHMGELYYVTRSPDRQWRRGLRAKGLYMYRLGADGSSELMQVNNDVLYNVAKYFIEERSSNENIISRDFARRGKWLFFRSIPVGTVKDDVVSMGFDVDLSAYVGDLQIGGDKWHV